MVRPPTSFLEATLPDATSWAYMSVVLVVMLFFRFAKPLQLRNLDVLLLFVLAVPLLYLRDVQEKRDKQYKAWISQDNQTSIPIVGDYLAATAPIQPANALMVATVFVDQVAHQKKLRDKLGTTKPLVAFNERAVWRAYFWLLMASAVLLVRSLVDLALENRTPFHANLTTGGLIWIGSVMMVILIVKSFLPEWGGVPRQQHPSATLDYLDAFLRSLPYVPDILALACHTLVLILLITTGITIFGNLNSGAAAAILYLLLPYTALLLLNLVQVVPSIFVLLALVCYRWPIFSALSLGIGTCIGFFPIILVPAWLGFYFRRGHKRFLFTYLAIILILMLGLAFTAGLTQSWNNAWELTEWQAWKFAKPNDVDDLRPHSEGLWNSVSLHIAYRIPLFIAFISLVAVSAFWPHPKNLGQLISWTAVLILGVQFWYADAGGTYILWYLPVLILQTLRPSLAEHRAAVIVEENDHILKAMRWINKVLRQIVPWKRKAAQPTLPLEHKKSTAA